MTEVALVIAVGETRCQLAQVAPLDWLAAQRAERLRPGCPAIDQDEFHVPPPNAKQNTVSDGFRPPGGGAQRWFRPSGLSRLCSTFRGGIRRYLPSSRRRAKMLPPMNLISVG